MRTGTQIVSELTGINNFILQGIPDNDISSMLVSLSALVSYMASTSSMVAEAGKLYNEAKAKAYQDLRLTLQANQETLSVSLAKDYISAKCGNEGYAKDLADRVNSAVIHSIDALRTAISAEKSLNQSMSYSQTR